MIEGLREERDMSVRVRAAVASVQQEPGIGSGEIARAG
jgi:hypothetical protein